MADVTSLYMRLRERARQIVSRLPPPDFYRAENAAVSLSELSSMCASRSRSFWRTTLAMGGCMPEKWPSMPEH